jgi:hypothetical protein
MPFPYTFPFLFPNPAEPPPSGDITPQTDVGSLAISRYAQYIKTKPNVLAITQVFTDQLQDIENAFQQLSFFRNITNGFGQLLDDIGEIVGRPRAGLTDSVYRLYLLAQIRANKSSGTTEDINAVFSLILSTVTGVTWVVNWQPPAAISIYITDSAGNLTDSILQTLVLFVRLMLRAAGVKAVVEYSEGFPDADYFGFDGPSPGFDQGLFRAAEEA